MIANSSSESAVSLNLGRSYDSSSISSKVLVYPDALRIRGSVLLTILPQVFFMMGFAAFLIFCKEYLGKDFFIPNSIVPSLSVVIGLLLVFRTNTAYDRYYEGRRLWTTVKTSVRNLSRTISFIPTPTPQDVQQKIDALKLLIAFSISVKDYLRDESDKYHYLLDNLLSERLKSNKFNALEFNLEESTYITTGYGAINNQSSSASSFKSVHRSVPDLTNPLANLPLEIATDLNTYTNAQRELNRTDPQTNNNINGTISSLVNSLGALERIRRTPIPIAYVIHMKQVVFLYCATLPLTLADLKWWSVLLIGIISFVLYGIDGIGQQIEDPFGYDENDLPLDQICFELQKEIEFVISKISDPEKFGLNESSTSLV